MRIFSYPFRITANGDIATVEQSSDQGNAEQIAMLLMTEKGEHVMLSNFGVVDAAFSAPDKSDIALQVALYVPQVTVTRLRTYYPDDATLVAELEFTE